MPAVSSSSATVSLPLLNQSADSETSATEVSSSELSNLLTELQIDEQPSVPILVKGTEGDQVVAFDQRRASFDSSRVLSSNVSVQANDRSEFRLSDIAAHIHPAALPQAPHLSAVQSAVAEANTTADSTHLTEAYLQKVDSQVTLTSTTLATAAPELVESASIDQGSTDLQSLVDLQAPGASLDDSPPNDLLPNASRQISARSTQSSFLAQTWHPSRTMFSSVPKKAPVKPARSPAIAGLNALQEAVEINAESGSDQAIEDNVELDLILVGLAVDDFSRIEATLVRGQQDERQAIAFDQWLIPFDDAMTALNFSTDPQPNGQLELRSLGIATLLDPAQLRTDPELGTVISIAQIREEFGIDAEFDFEQYAVSFQLPLFDQPLHKRLSSLGGTVQPIITEGLPYISPGNFALSGVRQSLQANSGSGIDSVIGQFSAVGTAMKGSWYTRLEQPDVTNTNSWQLREAQYKHQAPNHDYALGSQPAFWQSQTSSQESFWGVTSIDRWGFTPPVVNSAGGFNPTLRMHANQLGRTVSGEAEPGTLVQLTRGLNGSVVDEVIVNTDGVYRFEDVPVTGQQNYIGSGYIVQLFTNGQLTSQPEIRDASFSTLPGQLPAGASALVTSAGIGRQAGNSFLGNFNTFRGGLAYRRGLNEALTMGAGLVQDSSPHVLTEAFYLPANIPLQAALRTLTDVQTGETEVNADVRYQPTSRVKLNFRSDRLSQRFNADWKVSNNFTLATSGNTRSDTLLASARFNYNTDRWYSNATASFDTRQNLRWSLYAGSSDMKLSHRGDEVSTFSSLSYRLPDRNQQIGSHGHEFALSYETRSGSTANFASASDLNISELDSGQLTTAEWRYVSPERLVDGQSRWRFSLGYGIGSEGSGVIASARAALWNGIDAQLRYQGISALSDKDSFQLSLVSRLNPSTGQWGDRHQNRLRTQGRLLIKPFLDSNGNGLLDSEESLYLENPELLLRLNNEQLDSADIAVQTNGLQVTLPPDTYRIDIDPAGLPVDRIAAEPAYATEIVAGQHTQLLVPLALSYAVSGIVTSADGVAQAGTVVEVVSTSGHRRRSITNAAGVYYLERLQPEAYTIVIDGSLLEDNQLILENEEDSFVEKNIYLL